MLFLQRVITIALLLFVAAFPWYDLASAATKGRIMTNGKVTLAKNGQVVGTYTEQGPVDEGALITCDGACMVKMQGITLNAVDQTRFALKDTGDALNLFVGSGKVYFMVTDLNRQFAFFSPAGYQVKTDGFIAPASSEVAVKGFIEVSDKATEIGMDSGSMVVQTAEGTKTVAPGQTIVLAMADVPDPEAAPSGNEKETDEDKEGAWLGWESLTESPGLTTLAGIGVIGAVGLGAALVWDSDNDGQTQFAPPPPPPEPQPPPPPASRNR